MNLTIDKIKLKGHGSFYLREGWLRKGILEIIDDDSTFFSSTNAIDKLGVGANMVNAIKYYLIATGLIEEDPESKNKRKEYRLTPNFGKIIFDNDEYFEDMSSIWLLHYKLSTDPDFATSWYMFFNGLHRDIIRKEDIINIFIDMLSKYTPSTQYSQKSLADDITCIIRSYCETDYRDITPEENLTCPFSELGLLQEGTSISGDKILIKLKPNISDLDRLVVLYVIADNLNQEKNIPIKTILEGTGNLGKIFNFDRTLLNQYLDQLKEEGLIDINRTAGLDQVYVKLNDKEEILYKLYKENGVM